MVTERNIAQSIGSNAAESAAGESTRTRQIPNMIAVASGKGGVGKTFISSALAYALAREKQKVLLFDGDLGLANVDVQLGLTPPNDLGSVIAGRVTLSDALCRVESDQIKEGLFDVLAGKSGSGALSALSKPQMMGLIRGLTEMSDQYDRLIVDLPAGLDTAVTSISAKAGRIIVVVTDEPTSLTDAYAYIKIASRQADHSIFNVIVNQATTVGEAKLTFQTLSTACRNFLKMQPKLLGVVRRDPKVKEAIRAQSIILERSPTAPASSDLVAIAEKLLK